MGSRKRNKAEELKELNKNRVFAKLNNCPTSPRKMRLVADQVRGKKVEKALSILLIASSTCFISNINGGNILITF